MRAGYAGAIAARRGASVATEWFTVYERTGGGDAPSIGWNNYTFRMVVPAAAIARSGSKFRLTIYTGDGAGIGAAFVGQGAASGDVYDFAGSPTRITFGGNDSAYASAGVDLVSDDIDIAIDASKNLVVAVYFSGTSTLRSISPGADVDQTYWYKGGNDSETADAGGYTFTVAGTYSFRKVEIFG